VTDHLEHADGDDGLDGELREIECQLGAPLPAVQRQGDAAAEHDTGHERDRCQHDEADGEGQLVERDGVPVIADAEMHREHFGGEERGCECHEGERSARLGGFVRREREERGGAAGGEHEGQD
jgi:hypothetical protein